MRINPPSYLWHFLLQIRIFVYNFYSGGNVCDEKIRDNFILRELIFVNREKNRKKSQKLEPAKI